MLREKHTTDLNTAEVVCFGELLLRLAAPHSELLLQTSTLAVHIGGAEANVAVSLAQLGHTVVMATVLPDKPLGRACAGELRRYGAGTTAVRTGTGQVVLE